MVVPERMTQRQEVRSALAAQFWELPVSSARSLGDGAALALPCEPAPLAALAPQGAVRAQQLLAMQAGVGPLTPGYDGSNGGVVRRVSFFFFSELALSFFFVPFFLKKKKNTTPNSSFKKKKLFPFFLSSSTAHWAASAGADGGPPCWVGPGSRGSGPRTRGGCPW